MAYPSGILFFDSICWRSRKAFDPCVSWGCDTCSGIFHTKEKDPQGSIGGILGAGADKSSDVSFQ